MKTLIDPPLARDTDPITSHEAADKMAKSGKLTRQEQEVYAAIKEYLRICPYRSNFTAKDLRIVYMDYYTAQRRLSGLYYKGKIERTGEKRDGCCVWRLK
jgi:hypothetical protein